MGFACITFRNIFCPKLFTLHGKLFYFSGIIISLRIPNINNKLCLQIFILDIKTDEMSNSMQLIFTSKDFIFILQAISFSNRFHACIWWFRHQNDKISIMTEKNSSTRRHLLSWFRTPRISPKRTRCLRADEFFLSL